MIGTDPDQLLPDLDRLRARVWAGQRATSAPMLAFGGLILGYAAVGGGYAGQLRADGRRLVLLLYWPLATIVGPAGLWWAARRRAGQDGVGEGRRTYRSATRGYLVALVLIVVLFIPVLFIGVFTPVVWPAAVLATLACWQRNRLLGTWAVASGWPAVRKVCMSSPTRALAPHGRGFSRSSGPHSDWPCSPVGW
jgi:hypothetical protein